MIKISQQRTHFLSIVTKMSTTSNIIILLSVFDRCRYTAYRQLPNTHCALYSSLWTSAKVAACTLQKVTLRDVTHWID